MIRFARLLDDLLYSPSRLAKLALMKDYFASAPDPDRGYALAALAGTIEFRTAKPALIRALVNERVDPVLFDLSYDFVGDLAETTALIWPGKPDGAPPPLLSDDRHRPGIPPARASCRVCSRSWLDRLEPTSRWALLKLITGAPRVGVSARLAKTALAELGKIDLAEIEEAWHGITPPYVELFAWIEGRGAAPSVTGAANFRPLMLSNPLDEKDLATFDPAEFCAEWKWDGIRVQLVAQGGHVSLYSRTGDDIGGSFPELTQDIPFEAVLDGELLVRPRRGARLVQRSAAAPQPQGRHRQDARGVSGIRPALRHSLRRHARICAPYPSARVARDSNNGRNCTPIRVSIFRRSFPLQAGTISPSGARRRAAQTSEGVMLKRIDSPYLAGRQKGHWFKWKRDPRTVDAVLMYAQRGHGKRSSFYSDFTFGCWRPDARNGRELVPVGKAYFGFTDTELAALDKWVRNHTIDRHGPVRVVEPKLVIELAFDAVQKSSRHKSGVALRFPRVSRIRWDKPAAEADVVETLAAMAE